MTEGTSPASNMYYFNSQYLDPVFNQFEQMTKQNRTLSTARSREEAKALTSLTNLLREKERLLEAANVDVNNVQQKIEEVVASSKATLQTTVIDPLFQFYTRTLEFNNGPYPELSYFLGLSYIMLQGFRELMRNMLASCQSPNIHDLRQVNSKNCGLNNFADLLRVVQNPDPDQFEENLRRSTTPQVFNQLWLVDQMQEEKSDQATLLESLHQMEEDLKFYETEALYRGVQNVKQEELKAELNSEIENIRTDYHDSKLRESIIEHLRGEIQPWMKMLLFEGDTSVPTLPETPFKTFGSFPTRDTMKNIPEPGSRRFGERGFQEKQPQQHCSEIEDVAQRAVCAAEEAARIEHEHQMFLPVYYPKGTSLPPIWRSSSRRFVRGFQEKQVSKQSCSEIEDVAQRAVCAAEEAARIEREHQMFLPVYYPKGTNLPPIWRGSRRRY